MFTSHMNLFSQNNSILDTTSSEEHSYHTFNIYLINGYALSYDLFKNSNSSVKIHFDLSMDYSELDLEGDNITNDNNNILNEPYDSFKETKNISISLASYYTYNIFISEHGNLYMGGGPFIGFNSAKSFTDDKFNIAYEVDDLTYFRKSYSSLQTEEIWSLGITFILGIRSNITDRIGLFVESHFNFGNKWINTKQHWETNYTDNSYRINSSNSNGSGLFYKYNFVRVGLNITI